MGLCALWSFPAHASPLERAFDAAVAQFEQALPRLGKSYAGVDTRAYRDALTLRRFSSPHWGDALSLDIVEAPARSGDCTRFVAYVELPPRGGHVPLVVCPEFSASGTDALRRLTILHEIVHAVAGPDECRAMAFAAQVEQLASGRFTPVDPYWRANDCPASTFRLP